MQQAICPDCKATVALVGGRIIEHGKGHGDGNYSPGWWDRPFCASSGRLAEPKRGKLIVHGFPLPVLNLAALLATIPAIKVILAK
jgi:hypothetical protein